VGEERFFYPWFGLADPCEGKFNVSSPVAGKYLELASLHFFFLISCDYDKSISEQK
jgi:hypothetical protein